MTVLALLAKQATLLEGIYTILTETKAAAEADDDEGCAHEDRIDLRTFADQDHWKCRTCGYEHAGLTTN